jgi:MFS family permease
VVVFFNGAFTAVTNPARVALIPALVPRTHMVNAIGLNATVSQTCQIVGPALAGVIIAAFDLGWAYVGMAATYCASVLAIASIRAPRESLPPTSRPWQSLREGLSFVRSKPVIITLLALDVAQTVLGGYRALLPVIAEMLSAGEIGYGLLSAAPGVGNLAGATAMLAMGDMRFKGLYVLAGVMSYAVALAVLGLTASLPVALIATVALGFANAVQVVPRNAAILTISPDHLRGRVEAFRGMLAGGGPPVGFALSGAAAAVIGVPLTLTVGAAVCALIVFGIGLGRPELRERDLGTAAR